MLRRVSGWIELGATQEKSPIEFVKYEALEEEFGTRIQLKDGREYMLKSGELALSIRSNDIETKLAQLSFRLWAEFKITNHTASSTLRVYDPVAPGEPAESIVETFPCNYTDWFGRREMPSRPQNRCDLEGNHTLNIGFSNAGTLEIQCQLFEHRINEVNSCPISNAINRFKPSEADLPDWPTTFETLYTLFMFSYMAYLDVFPEVPNWREEIIDIANMLLPQAGELPEVPSIGYDVVRTNRFRLTGEWLSHGVFRLKWPNVDPLFGYYVYRKKREPPEKKSQQAWENINPIRSPEYFFEPIVPGTMACYTMCLALPVFSLGDEVHLDVIPTYTGDVFYVARLGTTIMIEPLGARQSDVIVAGRMEPPEYGNP